MNGVPFPIGPCVLALVMIAALSDLHTRKIPNWLVAMALVVALPVQVALHEEAEGMQMWLGGCLTGGLLLLPGYLMRLMGAGDVKLMAAVGAFCGAYGAFEIGLATFAVGGAWSLVVLLRRRQMLTGLIAAASLLVETAVPGDGNVRRRNGLAHGSIGTIPYGVAIAIGSTVVLFASV
ncbi:A24 family peptidase [Paraburkholderia sediminicola]|uniref:A24 family peptidase n=1 Tax=Paraburkholderia sediminicola TaxID=458836 RepID=UPI0038BB1D5E